MTENTRLTDFVAKLTSAPGVYRMLDVAGTVLYVGKAVNLAKRVSSYFTRADKSPKTRALVSRIASIEVDVTRTETEALILESNLIKALRPRYNILLRDDKSYPWVVISTQHPFPSLRMLRARKRPDKGECFGPYPGVLAVHETLHTLQKLFRIRNCTDPFFSARTRPCLQYQIKRCSAPCTGLISQDAYRQSVESAMRFLQGKSREVLEELEARMMLAAERLAFEEAAQLRDAIRYLRQTQVQQDIFRGDGDADVVAVRAVPGFACVFVCAVRNGQMLGGQSYFPSVPEAGAMETDRLWDAVFEAFLGFYYLEHPGRIPPVIITNEIPHEKALLESALSGVSQKTCRIVTNVRGARAGWKDFAVRNLETAISGHSASRSLMELRRQALAEVLGMTVPPHRIECFDISHTQGQETVASCVVFNADGPLHAEYRRFVIRDVVPGDDYGAMEQAIRRRVTRLLEEGVLPDLLVVDGGKGQFRIAQQVLQTLGAEQIRLLGIAKGPGRRAGFERLIGGDGSQELTLPADNPALHLLQHIRDEAHRFAITSHRKKRATASLHSVLEDIEGVGHARRMALLRRFGGLRELTRASVEEISGVRGIGTGLAERIHAHLNPEKLSGK